MADLKLSNNAESKLAADITSQATTLSLMTGEGALFPDITTDEYFPCTLVANSGDIEIVTVTARAGDVLTVVRGQEGTTALAMDAGSAIELRLTAEVLLNELARRGVHLSATPPANPSDGMEWLYVSATTVEKYTYYAQVGAWLSLNGAASPAEGYTLTSEKIETALGYVPSSGYTLTPEKVEEALGFTPIAGYTLTAAGIATALGFTPVNYALTAAKIASALGFTPVAGKAYADFYCGTGGITSTSSTTKTLVVNSTSINADTNIFELSANTVIVKKAMTAKVTAECAFNTGGSSRSAYQMWIEVNGVEVAGSRSEMYLRGYNAGTTGVVTKNIVLAVNDVIRLRIVRTYGTATTGYQVDNGTRICLEEK